MTIPSNYYHHDRQIQFKVAELNQLIFRQQLKHLRVDPTYKGHAWRKGMGLFVCIDRSPTTNSYNLVVAYCNSGRIYYLNSDYFFNQFHEYVNFLNNAFNT